MMHAVKQISVVVGKSEALLNRRVVREIMTVAKLSSYEVCEVALVLFVSYVFLYRFQ